jgi:ABC-2 type transport system permease protein
VVRATVGVAGLLGLCLATAGPATAAASNLLATRRGRDAAAFGAALLGVLAFVAFQASPNVQVDVELDLAPVVEVARWTPGGMAAGAIVHAVGDEVGLALLWLAGVGVWIAAALAVWGWAMDRTVNRQPAVSSSRRAADRASLYPRLLTWLPRTRTTAVAMRFLRGLARDNRVRTQALQTAFLLVPMVLVSVTSGVLGHPAAPLLAAMLAVPVGIIATNQLGLDGPALWQHELAGAAPRADLFGRNLALTIVALPLVVVAAVGVAAVTGGWAYVPIAIVLTLATLGVLFGVANVGAVLLPIPVPEASTNLFGSSQSGQGCVNGVLTTVVMIVIGMLTLPILLAMLFLDGVAAHAAAVAVALAYGGAVLWGGTWIAAERLRDRGPELLAAVDPGS